jgi:hypothetical protein
LKKAIVVGTMIGAAAVFGSINAVEAFELKGYKPGMKLADIDLNGCQQLANADSGVPGYRCNTTLGGEEAVVRLAIFEEQLVAAIFTVEAGQFGAMLDALSEKYGRPSKRNRFIEDYDWHQGQEYLGIKQNTIKRGYRVLMLNFSLYDRAKAAQKEKAKKDM